MAVLLTPKQREFAELHDADPERDVIPAATRRWTFVYRRDVAGDERWLIDEYGQVVDHTIFR